MNTKFENIKASIILGRREVFAQLKCKCRHRKKMFAHRPIWVCTYAGEEICRYDLCPALELFREHEGGNDATD